MAEITFNCSNCGVEIEADDSFAGAVAQCPSCNSTVMIPMQGIKPGMKIAGYEIIRRLGAGGMGEVWLAKQTAMDRKVAMKILSPALTYSKDFVDRFLKEVKTSAKLEHQNIVTAHDAGVENSIYYLAMSYVDGVPLENRLTIDKQIPEKEALHIVRSVAEALCYAWNEFHILHRDIKPSNIMLDTKKTVKLMDMGISKSVSEEKGLTMTGMIIGTPHYMSPEQARADADIDCRSDIYSLGATLYHLVTGEVPYDATTAMGILTKHITEPFPPPQEKNPNISNECSTLLEIMMSKKAENRQENWEDVIRDIDLVMNGKSPQTKRPGVGDSVIMQMTQSQALNRRRIVKSPPLAKIHSAEPLEVANFASKPHRRFIKISAVVAPILIVAIIVITVLIGKAKESKRLADAEKARIEQAAKKKADDEKHRAAELARAEKDKAEKELKAKALWDVASNFSEKALNEKNNFDIAIANFAKIQESLNGTKYQPMVGSEIVKLQNAKKAFDDEKLKTENTRKLAEQKKREAEEAAKLAQKQDRTPSAAEKRSPDYLQELQKEINSKIDTGRSQDK